MLCRWPFKRKKKDTRLKAPSSVCSTLSSFEALPDLPLENILEYLSAEDLAALQVCSDQFLNRCRDYILRGKRKSLKSCEQRYSELTGEGIQDIDPRDHTERCIWREIIRQAERRQIKFYRACIDINRLNREDIQRLVTCYRNNISYCLIDRKKGERRYLKPAALYVHYSEIQGYYFKPKVNFRLIFKALRDLRRTNEFFLYSCPNLKVGQEETLTHIREQSLRRYSSEVALRRRGWCLRIDAQLQ